MSNHQENLGAMCKCDHTLGYHTEDDDCTLCDCVAFAQVSITDVELGNRLLARVGRPSQAQTRINEYRRAVQWLQEHQHLPETLALIYKNAGPVATRMLHSLALELVEKE